MAENVCDYWIEENAKLEEKIKCYEIAIEIALKKIIKLQNTEAIEILENTLCLHKKED